MKFQASNQNYVIAPLKIKGYKVSVSFCSLRARTNMRRSKSNKQSKVIQRSFWSRSNELRHGGGIGKGKRKTSRPLERRKPIHLVMRSSQAKGIYSLKGMNRERQIESLVYSTAAKYGIKIASFANVGNHLHLLLQFQNRELFKNWLKTATGKIARLVTQARKGKPFGKFWDDLVFTRLIRSWRDAEYTRNYVIANAFEGQYTKWVRDLFLWQTKHQMELKRQSRNSAGSKKKIARSSERRQLNLAGCS